MAFTNIRQWTSAVEAQGRLTKSAISGAAHALATNAQKEVQDRIPPGAIDSVFPGYAATSVMKGSVKASTTIRTGDQYRASVVVLPHPKHPTIPLVHEYGMVIRAKRAPYLIFQIDGRWFRKKQVYIRPKHFFGRGWAEFVRNAPALLEQEIAVRMR